MSQTCRICSASGGHEGHRLRERMFGWGDEFDYFKCRQSGCLQIERVPADLAHYYSYRLAAVPQKGIKGAFGWNA